jgi:hypothetical protein
MGLPPSELPGVLADHLKAVEIAASSAHRRISREGRCRLYLRRSAIDSAGVKFDIEHLGDQR